MADAGTTWPRTARTRLIFRTASSKSPPSIAVMAAMSRLPTACPPSRPRERSSRPREAVLQQLSHERLGVGQRDDAVADVTDGRDAKLLAQNSRRATVVGHGHDRRQVAGVFLEAAQERRQAGPAADRDDPRATGQESLLVDHLDERLVASPAAEAGP